MVRFLYFLLLVILVRMAWSAITGWLEVQARRQMGASGSNGESERRTIHKGLMVKDPVCGLHLPEHRALSEVRSGIRYHFCSERCRSRFERESA